MSKTVYVNNESEMFEFAKHFAKKLKPGITVYLYGDLGAGKTTFVRGILRAMGYQASVKSPTFTIVEPYQLDADGVMIYHFDLYRINDPEELDFIGIRDYVTAEHICLIEWPEKAQGYLPLADITCYIDVDGSKRIIRIDEKSK